MYFINFAKYYFKALNEYIMIKPKIVIATNNKNKIAEIKSQVGNQIELLSLEDIGCFEELEETQLTIEGNALQKARYVASKYGVNCFADDTGLLIDALNGEPGVFSARYAGEQRNSDDNMDLVLKKLQDVANRSASFKTVIALIYNTTEYLFEGSVLGDIITEKSGDKGFGYDPIFLPKGFDKTFALFTTEEKNAISHRGKAVSKLIDFLKSQNI